MKILEGESTASVIAALWGNSNRLLSSENTKPGVKRLTRSSSRSMAESASMTEPLSDSMEEPGRHEMGEPKKVRVSEAGLKEE